MKSSLIERIKEFYKDLQNIGKTFVDGNTYIPYDDAKDILEYVEMYEQCIENNESNWIINDLLLQEVKKLKEEVTILKHKV